MKPSRLNLRSNPLVVMLPKSERIYGMLAVPPRCCHRGHRVHQLFSTFCSGSPLHRLLSLSCITAFWADPLATFCRQFWNCNFGTNRVEKNVFDGNNAVKGIRNQSSRSTPLEVYCLVAEYLISPSFHRCRPRRLHQSLGADLCVELCQTMQDISLQRRQLEMGNGQRRSRLVTF